MENILIRMKSEKRTSIYLILLIMSALLLLFIVLFAEFIAPYDPVSGNLKDAYIPPNFSHIFGTDRLGRDIFSRVIYGIRTSVLISTSLVIAIAVIGITLGTISGYFGGIVDTIIMRISDILISCPSMVLAIALAGIMGASVVNAMFAIFIVSISKYIRLARSLVIKAVSMEYVGSAKMSGASHSNIIVRHILPNVITPLFITASTDIGSIILEISALSFLGFGVPSSIPELGYMISDGRTHMLYYPWLVIFPGIAIFTIVSIFNLISDKLRDYFNS